MSERSNINNNIFINNNNNNSLYYSHILANVSTLNSELNETLPYTLAGAMSKAEISLTNCLTFCLTLTILVWRGCSGAIAMLPSTELSLPLTHCLSLMQSHSYSCFLSLTHTRICYLFLSSHSLSHCFTYLLLIYSFSPIAVSLLFQACSLSLITYCLYSLTYSLSSFT